MEADKKNKTKNDKCPYLTSEEDHWRTTAYPACSCSYAHCSEYKGYCPVRD